MAENRKFAALAGLRQQHASELTETSTTTLPRLFNGGRGGRPPGKRSDPSFEPTTVLLRKVTKKMANRKLEDTDSKLDLSDLIEQLLTRWTKES